MRALQAVNNNKNEFGFHCIVIIFSTLLWWMYQYVVSSCSDLYTVERERLYTGNYTTSSNVSRRLSNVNTIQDDVGFEDMVLNIQKYVLIQLLNGKTFVGQWNSLSNVSSTAIGGYNSGTVHLRLNAVFDLINNEDTLILYFKCYEDNYIDNWLAVTSFTNLHQLVSSVSYNTYNNNTNTTFISFNNSFITSYDTGKIFARTFRSRSPCKSAGSLSFQAAPLTITLQNTMSNESKNISIDTIDPSQINITFISECGINLSIQAFSDNEPFLNELISTINIYTIIVISTSVLSILSSVLLMSQLRKHESNITAISLFTLCQGFIWHSYCCLSNMNFGVNYPTYVIRFTLLSGCHMICFAIFDLKLIYTYWQILSRQLPYDIFLRKKLRFYICFYAFVFGSFFMLLKAYYDKTYITIMSVILWLPQIIFNCIRNNIVGLPFMYILITTLDRMFLPLYFRGYNKNLFRIRNDTTFIIGVCVYLGVNVCVLYVQVCCGGRCALTKTMKRKAFEYYKSRDELLKVKVNAMDLDCVICLQKVIADHEGENQVRKGNKKNDGAVSLNSSLISDNADKDKDVVVSVMSCTSNGNDFECYNNSNRKKKNKSIKWKQTIYICTNIYAIVFTFYKVNKNKENKPYMITPCGHVFHTKCLEEWFYCKKECPNCRMEMRDY